MTLEKLNWVKQKLSKPILAQSLFSIAKCIKITNTEYSKPILFSFAKPNLTIFFLPCLYFADGNPSVVAGGSENLMGFFVKEMKKFLLVFSATKH